MYNNLRGTGQFSYEAVAQRFTDHQAKWSENIFNEDALFKYIQPLIDDGNTAYLDMLQGSKAEQRKYWLYNRFKYLDSKYVAGDSASDVVTLRGYAKADIGVTPFQPIYVGIKYGSVMTHARGQANVETILECPLDLVNDTETYIYSASQIKAISDLTGYKVGYADFSKAVRLQNLVVHRGDANNTNANLTNLALGNNRLLQTLVCTYTPNLAQNINLSGCEGLQSIDFTGSSISGVTLANGSAIKTMVLPNTVSNLTLKNTTQLTTLNIGDDTDYSNLTTLVVENVDLVLSDETRVRKMLNEMSDGSRLRLIGFDFSLQKTADIDTLYAIFDRFTGVDESGHNTEKAQVSGTLTVDVISDNRIAEYKKKYPYININRRMNGYKVTFKNLGETIFVDEVGYGETASYIGDTPTKPTDYESGYETRYTFTGWDGSLTNVMAPRTVNAVYSSTNYYEVHFMTPDGSEELYTDLVQSGGTAVYRGREEILPSEYPDLYYRLTGWSSALTNITAEKTVTAKLIYHPVDEEYLADSLLYTSDMDSSRVIITGISPWQNLFDGNTGDNANSGGQFTSMTYYIGYNFGKPVSMKKVLFGNAGGDCGTRTVIVQGYNASTGWVNISPETWVGGRYSPGMYTVNMTGEKVSDCYEQIRLLCYAAHQGDGSAGRCYVSEVTFYGKVFEKESE